MLVARGLHTYYGASHVLHGVDLELPSGCALGLLGRNGMGKTTLLKSMLGLLKPRSGSVHFGGQAVTGLPPYEIARLGVGYVPEGRGIFGNLSVRENLQIAERPGPDGSRAWTYERVLEVFPRLKERLHTGGQQVSGGEQQMVAIGRALLTNPRVMILDEATEGLAPRIVEHIWQVIAQIRAGGISTIIVDRNYRSVLRHTERAVVLEKGRVALAGESRQLAQDEAALHALLGV
ncbi:ABC transporter ATP-binding protein [Ramlibacter solisilvae]|uniref:ABC transporter n=1 Tax=Ramlibacter tataouinensis TaxID=94132 RepID=A0A127JRH3_9BURK|nr:ABC transporter ATP-binding protein [Ramlibacter tataouinensis]AMO22493.1 ABC transporter [Ramlibacter tataouinensis]